MSECQLSENAIYKIIRQLRESGYIEREGGRKEGSWKMLKLQDYRDLGYGTRKINGKLL